MIRLSCRDKTEGGHSIRHEKYNTGSIVKQAAISCSFKYGVTKAAIRYKTSRQNIYRWRKRYDGTPQSLADRSHRPHSHPNQHTPSELKLIRDMRRRNPNAGLVVFWVKLRQRGYKRSISGLYRVLRRTEQGVIKLPNPKYIARPYEQMQYPGQRVQIDVKYVPAACLVGAAAEDARENGGHYYQNTFIDEYSRFRYLEAFKDNNTYSSATFIRHCVERFPFAIECVQTDNGGEFTNQMKVSKAARPTLFERTLAEFGIRHKRIKVFTPRHNGKVERSHRKDNEYFYASHKFYSFEDFQKQLAVWNRHYNSFPMRPLNWHSPKDVLFSFAKV